MKSFTVAVVGATGMVGSTMLRILEERKFPIKKIYAFASKRSAGKTVSVNGEDVVIQELTESSFDGRNIDIALFSAGGATSKKYAPFAARAGTLVIDNSSAWRMDPDVPLVVPEVNQQDIWKHKNIIANPNCSTIQAVVALKPLSDKYGLKRVVYSTYQAVSGAGQAGYEDLLATARGEQPKKFPYPIHYNIIPHIDSFAPDGYTFEEIKMMQETRKIMNLPELRVTATTVRVPVVHGHSESINVELETQFDMEDVKKLMAEAPGIILYDNPAELIYPMPIISAGNDAVFVGRLRRDNSVSSGLNMWVVADNIRKGAATNTVQIAECWAKRN